MPTLECVVVERRALVLLSCTVTHVSAPSENILLTIVAATGVTRHDVRLDLTTRRVTEAEIWRFAAVRATLVDLSGRPLTIGCTCGTHGTVCTVDMARCGVGGSMTAGVMLQVTKRGGITVFAWTLTNR